MNDLGHSGHLCTSSLDRTPSLESIGLIEEKTLRFNLTQYVNLQALENRYTTTVYNSVKSEILIENLFLSYLSKKVLALMHNVFYCNIPFPQKIFCTKTSESDPKIFILDPDPT